MTSDIARAGSGPGKGHEARDVNARTLLLLGLALATVIGLVLAISALFFGYLDRSVPSSEPRSPLLGVPDLPPLPRLQVEPHLELLQKRSKEDAILNSYGWVDRANGIVRIPIERAIDLTADRGFPVRNDPGSPYSASDAARRAKTESSSIRKDQP